MKYHSFLRIISVLAIILFCENCSLASLNNDAKIQYNRGIDFYQVGQYSQAADCFRNAVSLDPNYIDAYYNLGALMEYLHQDEDALNAFKQIILRKPDDYEAVYKAAVLSKRVGKEDKALMYLTLIPQDSIMGQKAAALAKSMQTDIETVKQDIESSAAAVEKAREEAVEKARLETLSMAQQAVENNNYLPDHLNNIQTAEVPVANTTFNYNNIASPTGVVTDKDGTLYVAGFSDNTIYKIGADNKKIVYIKSPKIDGPIGLAMDASGNIYIANYNKDNVLKVDRGGIITEILSGIKNPYCMHIADSYLYVSSQGGNSVVKYRL